MITLIIISVSLLSAIGAIAASAQIQADSTLSSQQKRIELLEQKCNQLTIHNADLRKSFTQTNKKNEEEIRTLYLKLDSLSNATSCNLENANKKTNDLNGKLNETQNTLQSQTSSLKETISNNSLIGVAIAALLAGVIGLVYFLLQKSKNKSIDNLKKQADELSAKMVGQMTTETEELRKIADSISKAQQSNSSNNDELSLVKRLADKICFMDNTLYRMDSSVRGYKQLTKSIKQMKDELKERGYELVDMLGTNYNEGMNLTANFVIDDTLPDGARIITSVRTPQINLNGKMIQCADIVVSQNI